MLEKDKGPSLIALPVVSGGSESTAHSNSSIESESPPVKRGYTFGESSGGMPITIQVHRHPAAQAVAEAICSSYSLCGAGAQLLLCGAANCCRMQDLNYTVINAHTKQKETLYLLKDVTGYFKPGQMAALVCSMLGPCSSSSSSTECISKAVGQPNF